MARQRTVKPEFFKDRKIAALGPHAALVYEALWCMADDGGVARCEPELVYGEMFILWADFSPEVVSQAILRLQEAGRIIPYRVGDSTYCEIPKFGDHQYIQHPGKFRYPRGGNGVSPSLGGESHESLMISHRNHGIGIGNGIGIVGTVGTVGTVDPTIGYAFDRFWAAYPSRAPRSNPKAEALRRFAELVTSGEVEAERLVQQAVAYAQYVRVTMCGHQFILQAQNFLGEKEGWRTDYTPRWTWLAEINDSCMRDLVSENLGKILDPPGACAPRPRDVW
jgi:hypothetical protein